MSELLQDAIEEVRMISASLQENSQGLRDHATGLRERATARVARGTHALERMAPWASPPPAEVEQAESQRLDIFKDGTATVRRQR